MKIAIVHDFLTKIGGAEKVLQTIHEIYPDAPIYTLLYDEVGTKKQFANNYDIRSSRLQMLPKFIRNKQKLLVGLFSKTIEKFDLSDYDLVISSSNSFAHGVITKPSTLHITYCYSPTRYLWDWSVNYLNENKISMGLKGLFVRSMISKIRVWDYYASKRTDKWIAISKTVANRIQKYYRQKSTIIYPPAEIDDLLNNQSKAEDYYLVVSRLSPYKNIDLAISVFNQINLPLYIIGEGSDRARLKKIAGNSIKFFGWQSDKNRNELIKKCKALIFPGEDDFGLTPIEAMAAGKPVIAFRAGGVTETVIEGKTGEFFNNSSELKEKILSIENKKSNYNAKYCEVQAKKFSKQIFIRDFKEFIESEYKKAKNDTKKN